MHSNYKEDEKVRSNLIPLHSIFGTPTLNTVLSHVFVPHRTKESEVNANKATVCHSSSHSICHIRPIPTVAMVHLSTLNK